MFNRQAFFNDSFRGMENQKWARSFVDAGSKCLYAGPNETGCAIGVNIPRPLGGRLDVKETPAIGFLLDAAGEDYDATELRDYLEANYGGPITGKDVDFLAGLQQCHDEGASAENRKVRFRDHAETWGLTIPFPSYYLVD